MFEYNPQFGHLDIFVVVVRVNNISKDLPVLLSRNLESFSLSGQWTWPSFLSSTDATNWPSSKLYWSWHKYKYTNIQIQKYMTQFSIQQNCSKLAICRTVLIMTRFHFQSWWFPKLWLAWCDSGINSPFLLSFNFSFRILNRLTMIWYLANAIHDSNNHCKKLYDNY